LKQLLQIFWKHASGFLKHASDFFEDASGFLKHASDFFEACFSYASKSENHIAQGDIGEGLG